MKKSRRRNVWGFVLVVVIGLIVGTLLGANVAPIAHTWLGHPLVLTPWSLDLYVVGFRVWIQTNVAGLVLAFVAALVYAAV